jgi:hypothetical protein
MFSSEREVNMRATFKGRADFERFLTLAIEHVDFLIPQEPEEAKVSVALTPAEWEEIFPDLQRTKVGAYTLVYTTPNGRHVDIAIVHDRPPLVST